MSLKVVVIGATGVVGSQVVEALIKHVAIKEVVTLTRKPVQYNSTKVLMLLSTSKKLKIIRNY
jgi:uncharacterized protein YbjT (DUF2867 family)